jgi:two-component system OmpR family response regulator
MSQKILIVEDEIELVKVIRDYLEKAGFRVDSVDNGTAAVSAFQHNPPDLVLLDLNPSSWSQPGLRRRTN